MWWGKAGESIKGLAKDPASSVQLSLLDAWLLCKQQSCWCALLHNSPLLPEVADVAVSDISSAVTSLFSIPCRQMYLQTPFQHTAHSDVPERIREAFETGCEFREVRQLMCSKLLAQAVSC